MYTTPLMGSFSAMDAVLSAAWYARCGYCDIVDYAGAESCVEFQPLNAGGCDPVA